MKTIYAESGKYALDEEMFSLVGRAVRRVESLLEEAEWVPSIEIPIPYTRHVGSLEERQGMYPTGQVFVRVRPWLDVEESSVESQARRLLGRAVGEGIKVSLGEYGHDGWMDLADHRDLRKLPEVCFTFAYVQGIVNPAVKVDIPNVREVEECHWSPLAREIIKAAEEVAENRESDPEQDQRARQLLSDARSYLYGELEINDLSGSIRKYP